MRPLDWNLAFWAVWSVTIQPYLVVSGLGQGDIHWGDLLFVIYAAVTFPIWLTVVLRVRRYLVDRLKPSLGYSPGDRVIVRGARATLIERMPAFGLLLLNQPTAADPESWWAITDDGERVGAHAPSMEHLPVLDCLAEL